jgi:dTDP-4-dehydrorhamnose reductase
MTVLIIGGDSMIGSSLAQRLRSQKIDVIETTRRVDRTTPSRLWIDLSQPLLGDSLPIVQCCVICAAVSRFDACAEYPEATRQINVEAAFAISRQMSDRGAHVLFLSSDQVFDGTVELEKPDSPRNPKSVYGRQKSEAEEQICAIGQDITILRLSKVLEEEPPLFLSWRDNLNAGKTITPYIDRTFAPTSLDYVLVSIIQIIKAHALGTFQASGDEDLTYSWAATLLVDCLNADPNLCQPIHFRRQHETVPPAPHTTLDTSRLEKLVGRPVPRSRDVLGEIFTKIAKSEN